MLGDNTVAARTARLEVKRFLGGSGPDDAGRAVWPDPMTLNDVLLVVSELVTNAVMHAATTPQVVVHFEPPAAVCIEVSDPVATMPMPRQPAATVEGGRGLGIVATVASSWGVDQHPGDGKTVWATFGTTCRAPAR